MLMHEHLQLACTVVPALLFAVGLGLEVCTFSSLVADGDDHPPVHGAEVLH